MEGGGVGPGEFDDVDLAALSSFGSKAEGRQEDRQVREGVNPRKQRGKSKRTRGSDPWSAWSTEAQKTPTMGRNLVEISSHLVSVC